MGYKDILPGPPGQRDQDRNDAAHQDDRNGSQTWGNHGHGERSNDDGRQTQRESSRGSWGREQERELERGGWRTQD